MSDLLTKGLNREGVEKSSTGMGLWPRTSHRGGNSTMESEFIALDKVGEEAEWLRNFLEDIPFWPKPMALYAYIVIVKLQ